MMTAESMLSKCPVAVLPIKIWLHSSSLSNFLFYCIANAGTHLGAVPYGREIRSNAFLINFSLVFIKKKLSCVCNDLIQFLIFCLQLSKKMEQRKTQVSDEDSFLRSIV